MDTKTCSRCDEEKDINEFAWKQRKKGIRQAQCHPCRKQSQRENYQRNNTNIKRRVKENKARHRKEFHEWKATLFCEICGENEECCLEFHHRDPKKKDLEVSRLIDWSLARAKKEAAKCAVLCSNCHKKVHAGILMLG